jgi:hypothetical protein
MKFGDYHLAALPGRQEVGFRIDILHKLKP